ncbi:hypothetical protein N9P74_00585 [bacterium]|nr:hypothetical protein [bacterium]MDB0072779.1 hypothetical protein [bacterium]
MNQAEKAQLYDRYMSDYDRIGNEIGIIKMNNFELTKGDTDKIRILEQKLTYIRQQVENLN